jgi:hypothetical protein
MTVSEPPPPPNTNLPWRHNSAKTSSTVSSVRTLAHSESPSTELFTQNALFRKQREASLQREQNDEVELAKPSESTIDTTDGGTAVHTTSTSVTDRPYSKVTIYHLKI